MCTYQLNSISQCSFQFGGVQSQKVIPKSFDFWKNSNEPDAKSRAFNSPCHEARGKQSALTDETDHFPHTECSATVVGDGIVDGRRRCIVFDSKTHGVNTNKCNCNNNINRQLLRRMYTPEKNRLVKGRSAVERSQRRYGHLLTRDNTNGGGGSSPGLLSAPPIDKPPKTFLPRGGSGLLGNVNSRSSNRPTVTS